MLNFWVRYQASEKQPPWAYRSLIIETDATMAPGCAGRRRLQAVRNGRNRHGSEASVVFRVFFFSVSLSMCPRICNRVAHALAVIGCKSPSEPVITWEVVPQGVGVLVSSDLAGNDD
jgi:hypothetical protein